MSEPRYRWVVLAAGSTAAGSFGALNLPALGPALRDEYDLSLAELGMTISAVAVGMLLGLLPWGMVTDRIGERTTLSAGLGGCSAALLLAAEAPGHGAFVACLLLAGFLGSAAIGASGRAVMGWFRGRERGMALGVRQMATPLGGAAAAVALPLVVSHHGLAAGLRVLAATTAVGALLSVALVREPRPRPPVPGASRVDRPTSESRLWRLGVGCGFLMVAQASILAFVVVFLHDERDLSASAAAGGLAALMLLGSLGRLVAGRWSDRRRRRIMPMREIAAVHAIALLALGALADAPGGVLYPLLALTSVTSMCWNGLGLAAAAEITGYARAGTAMGLVMLLITFGGTAAPAGFGALVGLTSWPAAFALLALFPLAGRAVLGPLTADEDRRAAFGAARRLDPRSVRSPA